VAVLNFVITKYWLGGCSTWKETAWDVLWDRSGPNESTSGKHQRYMPDHDDSVVDYPAGDPPDY